MATLPEMLRAEQTRCRQIAQDYAALGSTGAFARALIEQALRTADDAVKLSNVIAMQRALDGLRRFREVPPALAGRMAPSRRIAAPLARPAAPGWVAPPPREQFFTWTRRAA